MFSSVKKSLICLSFSFFLCMPACLFAESASAANRKTAVRYLKLAEQYAAQKKWAAADSNAELGLAYDDSIADLWYIRAVSKTNTGTKKCQVIPFIQKALTEAQWVDYNKESARVLYADILCSTREFEQCLTVLDNAPLIYSADAEYLRAKAYYNLPARSGVSKAREKIDAARRVYPEDQRFAELFFRYEYSLGGRNEDNAKIADSFIKVISLYKKPSVDLEIYAAIFAQGEQKIRMLKSFNARSLKSPLYAVAALEEGVNLLKEDKALDYFYSFADKSIDYSVLLKFASALKDPEIIREFGEYLNQYGGTVYKDTDGDLSYNLKVEYVRGRPQKISYDKNQDDQDEWVCECDFGVPVVLHLTQGALDVEYSSWPAVSRAVYDDHSNGKSFKLAFNLVAEALVWTPFEINSDSRLNKILGMDFFVPSVIENAEPVSGQQLLMASSSYSIPTKERKNGLIKVSVLDGKAQMARYYVNDVMYAQTQFRGGMPVFRTVDMDGDGLFETTETYGWDPSGKQTHISTEDELQIMTNVFGDGVSGSGFYVKMIQIDQNGDTVPDFTEEYTENLGKISSWDLNSDGQWEIRYVKYPASQDGSLVEEALFYQPLSNALVTVTTKNGLPYRVSEGGKTENVVKSADYDVYWIGNAGTKKDAEKILNAVNLKSEQGVCTVLNSEAGRMLAVRAGQYIFGQLLPAESPVFEKVEVE